MAPNSETIRETLKKLTAYFEAPDMEGWLALCTEDLRWTMVGSPTVAGKAAVREFMTVVGGDNAPAPKLTIKEMVVEGNLAVAHGIMDMINEKGEPGKWGYTDWYRFEGDKISEMITYILELKEEGAEA